ncbi:MAG: hypothetical protein KDD37_01275 [Bdellovibrionales bacterium]|nr:hypothetical protein [Bdellovibrionales bacterium]
MGLQHRHVQYMDFDPSVEQKDIVERTIEDLSEHMPEDATAHSIFKFKGRQLEGNLRFNSKMGAFVAHAKAKNVLQLIKKLRSKILSQWRHKKTILLSR